VLRYLSFIFKSNLFRTVVFFGAIFGAAFFCSGKILKSGIAGFNIRKIEFDGNERVQDLLLLKTSGLKYKSNIFAVSVRGVKRRLESIAWIKSAVVQRKLPDTIRIRVAERIPIAILQSKYNLYLIDADGKVLEHDGIGNFGNLPIVTGEGAAREADRLLCCLNRFPKIRRQLVFAVRIGKRRWNIKINRGITVKLPEKGMTQALGILEEISDKNGYFNDDMATIDMRVPDRIIIKKQIGKAAKNNE
jgi:cell division protein FtsQ